MKIFIDADGCPVVKLACEIAKRYKLNCVIVCDTAHEFRVEGVEVVTVSKGADSADFRLVNMLEENDICITQDYGLAAMCLSRRAIAINQNGVQYDNNNIDAMLYSRYTAKKIRNAGGRLKGPKKRDPSLDKDFAVTLERVILENQ